MAYDEGLAERIRNCLDRQAGVTERRMFGGLAFMVQGHMCVGVSKEHLMVRVGAEAYHQALAEPHARKMDFTGKPLTGFVFVDPPGYAEDRDLSAWVARALEYVRSLPPK